jgi:hypothetical protein
VGDTVALKTVMKLGSGQEGRNSGRKQLISKNCVDRGKHGGELEGTCATTLIIVISQYLTHNISRIAGMLNLFLMCTGNSHQLLGLPSLIKPDMILLVLPILLLKMGDMVCSNGLAWVNLTILYLMDTLRWFIYRYLNNNLQLLRQGYVVVEGSFVPVLFTNICFSLIWLKI